MERNICTHFMYGYCKLKYQCPKEHIDVICPNYKECEDNGCVNRHPKTCKYFEKNGMCRFEKCAYSHDKEGNNLKIEILENKVSALKLEIESLTKRNQEIQDVVRKTNSDRLYKLSNTIEDVVERLRTIEQEQMEQRKMKAYSGEIPKEGETGNKKKEVEIIVTDTNANSNRKDTSASIHNNSFKCDQCSFISDTRITLNKHTNTKHAEQDSGYECSLCEDSFSSSKELKTHIDEHIEEIEGLNIAELTKGHDLFECNLCSFESGHEDSIREHLIAHVNPQNKDHSGNILSKKAECQAKSLLDEYDDDGNYIGDNPKYMDDYIKESDTEDEEE